MNNKGFTLIELLVVIAIVGSLGTIITISLNKTLKNTNDNSCKKFVQEVEEAGCTYASKKFKEVPCTREKCDLKLSTLIKEGLIEDGIDDCTGKNIDKTKTVSVTWNDAGEKDCHYNGVREYAK